MKLLINYNSKSFLIKLVFSLAPLYFLDDIVASAKLQRTFSFSTHKMSGMNKPKANFDPNVELKV